MSIHTHFSRAMRFAVTNMYRNFWLSLMTVTILILSLFSVSVIMGLNGISKQLIDQVKSKVDVSIPVRQTTTEDETRGLVARLQNLQEVKSVTYISPDEALEQFKAEHAADPDIQETLTLLDGNPLPARIVIRAKNLESFDPVLAFLRQDLNRHIVESENSDLEQSQIVIAKLTDISNKIGRAGLFVTIIFCVIAFLVIFNTIRIAIYTHREEIGIMKLVGASNWFVRSPFLIESVLYALLAVIITLAILYPILSFISPQLNQAFFGEYGVDITQYFSLHMWTFVGYQLVSIALLSMASSSFAISRYLKV